MKKITLLFTLLLLANTFISATTWETINYGFWDDPTIWSLGQIPPTSSSDTFLIKHPIAISQDLTFESGAYVLIESEGGICGHQKVTVLSNTDLISYGILELDDLYINGGYVGCLGGSFILASSATVTGSGGFMEINGGGVSIGVWFDCILPLYSFLLNVDTENIVLASAVKVYPNPFSNNITIETLFDQLTTTDKASKVKICDLVGRVVVEAHLTSEGLNQFDLGFLKSGIYLLTVSNQEKTYSTKIIKS